MPSSRTKLACSPAMGSWSFTERPLAPNEEGGSPRIRTISTPGSGEMRRRTPSATTSSCEPSARTKQGDGPLPLLARLRVEAAWLRDGVRLGVEGDDSERVRLRQDVGERLRRADHLRERLSVHRARDIEHEDDREARAGARTLA